MTINNFIGSFLMGLFLVVAFAASIIVPLLARNEQQQVNFLSVGFLNVHMPAEDSCQIAK